eukprot:649509-Rhodomonas_salina.1
MKREGGGGGYANVPTEPEYGAMRYAHQPSPWCYAISSTALAYGAMQYAVLYYRTVLCDLQYRATVWSYGMLCAEPGQVLSEGTLLPARVAEAAGTYAILTYHPTHVLLLSYRTLCGMPDTDLGILLLLLSYALPTQRPGMVLRAAAKQREKSGFEELRMDLKVKP